MLQKGQSIIEILIAIALTSLLIPALLTGLISSRSGRTVQQQRLSATAILKESAEAVRSVRERDWSLIASDGTYHPVISGSTWALSPNSEVINGYTRKLVISAVLRNSLGAIVDSGGVVDPSTKKIIASVSWSTPFSSSVSQTLYLTRYGNQSYTETTLADFNSGNATGTAVVAIGDGAVTLAPGGSGRGDWCDPGNSVVATYNLSGQGITTAISATSGHSYTTTGGNASGHSMDSIDISDPVSGTPVVSNESFYDNFKTYGIYDDGSYAYLTSDHPGLTVDIVQTTSRPYSQTGTFSSSGGEKGDTVFVSGGVGYVTGGSNLYTFDLTSHSGSRPQLGRVALAGAGKRVIVLGNYAYIATASTTNQLQIVNISDPTHLSITASLDLKNNLAGVDLSIDSAGSHVYIVTSYLSSKSDFYIVDIADASSPKILGSYSTNGMNPKGVVAIGNYRAAIVGSGVNLYQVLRTFDPNNPTSCGFMNPSGVTSINAIATVFEDDGDAYSYILTDDASHEFQIISGGPGGQVVTSGTFESQIFNSGAESAFNRFDATIASLSLTNIQYQIAIAHAISGSCSGVNFSYVGPDGTASTKFATASAIPTSIDGVGFENPGQCLRYKAFFSTTDPNYTPTLFDISFNYSK